MTSRYPLGLLFLCCATLLVGAGALDASGTSPGAASFGSPREARSSLDRARKAASEAEGRAQRLTAQAAAASVAADKATREAAALAARIQLAEANSLAAEARLALIKDQRRVLDRRLAQKQQPIVKLTAALQNMARRPLALSALQPGSLKDTVHLRAVLASAIPEVRARTQSLRADVERGRALEQQAGAELANFQKSEKDLEQRRGELAALAQRKRARSRDASGSARRENDRALALAEQARDLDTLVGELDQAAGLRRELAALSGPIIRPPRPSESRVVAAEAAPVPTPSSTAAPADLRLPVQGRTITGFGEIGAAGLRSNGIALAPRPGAVVVAPAGGRVAFAGDYRGYGRIVIIEHANGWTSLVTGLGRTDVLAGEQVLSGSPLGVAPSRDPAVSLELRKGSETVNPLQYME